MPARPSLRLTIRLALIVGSLVCLSYVAGGVALFFHAQPEFPLRDLFLPRYFSLASFGLIQIAIYLLLFWLLFRGITRRKWLTARLAGAVFFFLGILGTFGEWNLQRDFLAGLHLFVGIVLWRFSFEGWSQRSS